VIETLAMAGSAFWIGLLTAISPCPLATNIAAVSFVSYRIQHKPTVLLSGALYTLGRSLTYIALSVLIVQALVNVPVLSDWLQRHMNKVLGLLLILTGMVLAELLPLRLPGFSPSEKLQSRLDRAGLAGSLGLGALFALAFCPVSAALFFGSLVPLAVKAESSVGLPLIYGVGTGLPVLVFAMLVAAGSTLADRYYRNTARLGEIAKKVTGVILIGVGVYLTLKYVFEII
jgi:cytochrome c biogenesis protein CcdA